MGEPRLNHDCWKQLCPACRAYVDELDGHRASDLRAAELEGERDEARAEVAAREREFIAVKHALDTRIAALLAERNA